MDHSNTPPKSILEEAQEIIYGDREKTYGSPDKNLLTIAEYWTTYLARKYDLDVDLDANDVCVMMTLLKLSRLGNSPEHRDSKVDTAGYIALMQRVQDHHNKVSVPTPEYGPWIQWDGKSIVRIRDDHPEIGMDDYIQVYYQHPYQLHTLQVQFVDWLQVTKFRTISKNTFPQNKSSDSAS